MSASVNLKAVLCDLDGTLIDSGRDVSAAFLAGWRHLTDDPMPDETTVIRHIGKPHQAMLEAMGLTGVSDDQLESFRQVYRSYFEQHGTKNTQPFPGVRDTLSQLAKMSLGVVTTKGQDQAEMVLKKLDLAQHFHHVQGAPLASH